MVADKLNISAPDGCCSSLLSLGEHMYRIEKKSRCSAAVYEIRKLEAGPLLDSRMRLLPVNYGDMN